jgi:hypothetical protein
MRSSGRGSGRRGRAELRKLIQRSGSVHGWSGRRGPGQCGKARPAMFFRKGRSVRKARVRRWARRCRRAKPAGHVGRDGICGGSLQLGEEELRDWQLSRGANRADAGVAWRTRFSRAANVAPAEVSSDRSAGTGPPYDMRCGAHEPVVSPRKQGPVASGVWGRDGRRRRKLQEHGPPVGGARSIQHLQQVEVARRRQIRLSGIWVVDVGGHTEERG